MEVHAMAMVLAVLLTMGLADEDEEEEKSSCRQHRTRACRWTLWCCNRAPRGWRPWQLVLPWLTVLVLCMSCLGVAGHGIFSVDTRASVHHLADGPAVHDQEARPVTCHPLTSECKYSATESIASFDTEKVFPTGFEAGNMQTPRSLETEDTLAGEEFVPASCTLPGWSYVLSSIPQDEASAEINILASLVQEHDVIASVDWGSNSLSSVSLKVLTLTNRQTDGELQVLSMFTTNTQFCTVGFQQAVVSPGSKVSIVVAYFVNLVGKTEGKMLLQTSTGRHILETFGEGTPFLYPLLGLMGVAQAELRGTVSFFNPFDESVSVEKASNPGSCKPSRLKVRPKADWFLSPHSLSPIMDFSITIDDGEHVVGALFFTIFQHCVQLVELLAVPMELERVSTGTRYAKSLVNQNLSELVILLELVTQSGQTRFSLKSSSLPMQCKKNSSTRGQGGGLLLAKNLGLDMSWVCSRGKSTSAWKLSCMPDLSSIEQLIAHVNRTTHPAAPDLCGVPLFYAVIGDADVDERSCLATLSKCEENACSHKEPCKAESIDSSLSMASRTWTISNARFHVDNMKEHDCRLSEDMGSNALHRMQGRSIFKEIRRFGCSTSYRHFEEDSVAEHCFGAYFVPIKSIVAAALSPILCHMPYFSSRNQKWVLKLFLLILLSLFVLLIKLSRQEKLAASNLKLRQHTFFLQSVCLGTGYVKVREGSGGFEHDDSLESNSRRILECQDDQCYENKFSVVVSRVVGNLGSIVRSLFDSEASVLNVRVHISESPRVVSMEQASKYSKKGLMADQKDRRMLDSTTEHGSEGSSCKEPTDNTTSRLTHFEANTVPSSNLAMALPSSEDVHHSPSSWEIPKMTHMATTTLDTSSRPIIDVENVQLKETKEKGKRKKRRSKVSGLKQESDRMGRSGSSSPPSSPASPATPGAYSTVSPFIQCEYSRSRSFKASPRSSMGHSNVPFRETTHPRSTSIQFSSEALSQVDVGADPTCKLASKGRLQHFYSLGSKASLEPLPTRNAGAAKVEFCRKGSIQKDRIDTSTGENWAAVARRAITSTPSEADQWQHGLSSSSTCEKESDVGIRNKPVLLPLATFPQSGRSMQWDPPMVYERGFMLNDPTPSPSLTSTSLVAPSARAPGSKLTNHYSEDHNNILEAASGQLEMGRPSMHEGSNRDASLYDIWGDHFAGISCCRTQTLLGGSIREHDIVEIRAPEVGNVFAASALVTSALTLGRADAAAVGPSISIPSAGFSVFSCDTFFPPSHQRKDEAGASKP